MACEVVRALSHTHRFKCFFWRNWLKGTTLRSKQCSHITHLTQQCTVGNIRDIDSLRTMTLTFRDAVDLPLFPASQSVHPSLNCDWSGEGNRVRLRNDPTPCHPSIRTESWGRGEKERRARPGWTRLGSTPQSLPNTSTHLYKSCQSIQNWNEM